MLTKYDIEIISSDYSHYNSKKGKNEINVVIITVT